MISIREQILARVMAALAAIPALSADGAVERHADTLPAQLPAARVLDLGDAPVFQDLASIRRALRVQVFFYIDGDGGEGLAANLDALQSAAHVALLADPQWGGLAEDSTLGALDIDPAEGAEVRECSFSFTLDIRFSTRRLDPAAQ